MPDAIPSHPLEALRQAILAHGRDVSSYLGTPEGQADANAGDLNVANIALISAADALTDEELTAAVRGGDQALAVLKEVAYTLEKTRERRTHATHDLGLARDLAAFTRALGARDSTGIATTGRAVVHNLRPIENA